MTICIVFAVVAFALSGCEVREKYVTPEFDHTFIRTVGVSEFHNMTQRNGAGLYVSRKIDSYLRANSPYKVVSLFYYKPPLISPGKGPVHLGRDFSRPEGVELDALLAGSVDSFHSERGQRGSVYYKRVSLTVNFALIRISNAETVWQRTFTEEVEDSHFPSNKLAPYEGLKHYSELFDEACIAISRKAKALYPHTETYVSFK
ncbi:MAG: hypothetical protein U5N86_06520 [Planctomycetota bacterium]|nr:hypothetical protein [Planctomycetota bacterium]